MQDPEAELSRIKVQVRRKKEEMKAFSLPQDVDQIPELISNAETILRNVNMRKEMGISFQAVRLLPVEEIERTRKVREEDEKKLYEVRKSIHASKEILSFMEFRFSLLTQKNNILVAKIDRKNSNPKIHSRVHQNNLLNNESYKSQGLLAVNVKSPKKANTSKDKMLKL